MNKSKSNNINPKQLAFSLATVLLFWCISLYTFAQQSITVKGDENGLLTNGYLATWHDPTAKALIQDVIRAYSSGQFTLTTQNHSTGLIKGTLWGAFSLKNDSDKPVRLQLEYVDHQLISMHVFARPNGSTEDFKLLNKLSLTDPFSYRSIAHNRFVTEVTIEAGKTTQYLVRYDSAGSGYIFPNLRIWTPTNIQHVQTTETSGLAFLFGGLFLMSIVAFVAGVATKETFFFAYSFYAVAKILAWATIFGYTHKFVLVEDFHWSYISISASFSIFAGLLFCKLFLQTAKFTPILNYVLLAMMANAIFLCISAVLKLKEPAVISITLALLLYPTIFIVACRRWLQGTKEAGIFALAWSFLAAGLVTQALRDLGVVEHNFINYYWPPFASYTEMIVIMVAMGFRVNSLRTQKIQAERQYRLELEQSKSKLEILVKERTQDIEQQKRKAELEARTDLLTGTRNRRSFFIDAEKLIENLNKFKTPISLLMFDIDNFKAINDAHGHSAGDQAIQKFSDAISSKIREEDIFARIGGEEFALLVQMDRQQTLQLAEQLREDISNIKLILPKGPVTYTTSIGISYLTNEITVDELLLKSDYALYQAKHKGRNQVIEWT